MGSNDENKEAEYLGAVEVANHLLDRFGVNKKVKSIKECDDDYFLTLYEALIGEQPHGVTQDPVRKEDKITNCQFVIDALAKEVLDTDLSHIEGKDIVIGNLASVANLLEIFMGLLEYIFEELQKDEQDDESKDGEHDDNDDSNLLSSDHDILSDVIQEEFGSQLKAEKEWQRQSKRSPTLIEKYLIPTGAPTRDTDEDSASVNDFTKDSLLCEEIGKDASKTSNCNKHQKTFQVQPFAYVSTSTLDSTEELTSVVKRRSKDNGVKDVISSSTSKLDRRTSEEKQPLRNEFRKTDPGLCTSFSKRRYQGDQLPEDSMSSVSWPSILSANALNAAEKTPFQNVGVRPRVPLPGEVSNTNIETSTGLKHQHTHHHYYHYQTPRQGLGGSQPDSLRNAMRSSDAVSGKLVIGDPKLKHKADVTDKEISLQTDNQGSHRRQELNLSRHGHRSSKKQLDSKQTAGQNTESAADRDLQPARMRSVQTSVSDMPIISEKKKEETSATHEGKVFSERIPSDRSSISELNDLLNNKSEVTSRPRTETLKELDKKLEEVRAAVRELEKDKLLSISNDTGNIHILRNYLDDDAERFRSSVARKSFTEEANESICSDSEFDYGSIHRQVKQPTKNDRTSLEGRRKHRKDFEERLGLLDDDDEPAVLDIRPRKKKEVQFKDFVAGGRDERLERLIKSLKQEDRENEEKIDVVKKRFSRDLKEAQKKQMIKPKEDIGKSYQRKEKQTPLQKNANNNYASRLARVYGQRARKPERDVSKQRKRSASCSPVPRARRKGRLVVEEDDILPLMEDEFPHLYLSPTTAKLMWQKQLRQISNLTKAAKLRKPTNIEKQIEDSRKKQEALMNIMKKELEHNKRLKETKEKAQEQRQVKNKLRERRLASARARKYYDDYQVRTRARMLKRRTKEEKLFKQLFEDALEIQKERVRELRTYAKEQREMDAQRKQNELDSIENFYRDQFSMMAETVARERYDIQVREKAQTKVIENMRKGIRQRMEKDIKCLQEELVREEDSSYFRHLDADNLRKELQLATYKVRL